MNLIETGIQKKLIRIDAENGSITYIHQDIRRNYNNPEEKVQAETFLKLILHYKSLFKFKCLENRLLIS